MARVSPGSHVATGPRRRAINSQTGDEGARAAKYVGRLKRVVP